MDKEDKEAIYGLTGTVIIAVVVVLGGAALAGTAVRIFCAIAG